MRRYVIPLALIASASCTDPVSIADRQPLDPPGAFRTWHAELVDCIGARFPFDRVSWFIATDIEADGHTGVEGLWQSPHRITIAGWLIDQADLSPDQLARLAAIVKHELTHDYLQRGTHDSPLFEACSSWP